jgi:hypothetical protein
MRDLLPEGKLTQPFIWVAGVIEDPAGDIVMVRSP